MYFDYLENSTPTTQDAPGPESNGVEYLEPRTLPTAYYSDTPRPPAATADGPLEWCTPELVPSASLQHRTQIASTTGWAADDWERLCNRLGNGGGGCGMRKRSSPPTNVKSMHLADSSL